MNLVNNISEDKNFKLNLPLSWPRDFKMSTSSYQKYWLWSLFILWSTLVWNTSCLAKCWLPGALKDIKLPSLCLQMEGLCLLKVQSQLSLSCPSSMWLSFSINRKETRIVSLIVHHFQRAKVLASKNLRSCRCNHLITKGLWTSVLLAPYRANHAITPLTLAGNSSSSTWRKNEVPSKKKKKDKYKH